MNLYQKKRRTPVLQIISMIDVLIILLIFLVVSTTFKDPRAKPKAAAAPAPERSIVNVAIPVSESMNLGTDTESRVSLSITAEEKCYLADVEIPMDRLAEGLRVFRESSPAAKLDLRIDKKVTFESLIRIWDALTKSGYKVGDVPARVLKAAQ